MNNKLAKTKTSQESNFISLVALSAIDFLRVVTNAMRNKIFAFTAINCQRNYISSQAARDGTVTIFPILNVYCILCMALWWIAKKTQYISWYAL